MASSINELSQYRLERAREELDNAISMFDIGKYKMA